MSDDCILRQTAIDIFKNAIGDKYPFICEPILITLSLIPSVTPKNTVSAEVYKQVAKERDIAIEQLNELGYEFGEKIEQQKTGRWIAEENKEREMKPQGHYCLEDIVTRVNGGDYIPIGETRYDDEAYERQKTIENLIDYLVDGLSQICQKNAVEYSIQQANKEAKRYLRRLSDDISDMLDEVNGY